MAGGGLMAKHNLAYQIDSAIQQAFRPGADKHSGKHTGDSRGIVYSYNEKKSLQQVGYEFKSYMRANFPGIEYVKDIEADHWQGFLNQKSETCSTATIKNYVSRISKIEVLCQSKFRFKSNWAECILTPQSAKTPSNEKLRTQMMDKNDLVRVLDYGYKNCTSKGVLGIDLSYRFGLRDAEVASLRVRDIDYNNRLLHVVGKGGRHRYLVIEDSDLQLLKNISKGKCLDDRLVGINADSINQQLNRILKTLKLKDKYPLTSIHSIRKLKAQELWTTKRNDGCSKKETMDYVSSYLGHGKGRFDIINIYVQNQH